MSVLKAIKANPRVTKLVDLIREGKLDTTNCEAVTVMYEEVDSAIYVDFLPRPKAHDGIRDVIEQCAWALGKEVGLTLEGFTGWDSNSWFVIEV